MFFALASVIILAASAIAAPLSAGAARYAPLGARSVIEKRYCHPMPSKVDPAMRDLIYTYVRKQTKDPKILHIVMTTAYVESMVNNLNCGDKDSKGLFQQRPSQNWGTDAQIQTPTYAIDKFLEALMPIYRSRPNDNVGELCQAVQHAEAGNQYTRNEATGLKLIDQARASVGGGDNDDNDNDTSSKPTKTKSSTPAETSTDPGHGGAINIPLPTPPASGSDSDSNDSDNNDDGGEDCTCTQQYTPVAGDNCYKVAEMHNISLADFYELNPEIDEHCQNLYAGKEYCVAAN